MRRPPSIEDVSSQDSRGPGQRPEFFAQAAALGSADEVDGVAADQAVGGGVVEQGGVAFGVDDAAAGVGR